MRRFITNINKKQINSLTFSCVKNHFIPIPDLKIFNPNLNLDLYPTHSSPQFHFADIPPPIPEVSSPPVSTARPTEPKFKFADHESDLDSDEDISFLSKDDIETMKQNPVPTQDELPKQIEYAELEGAGQAAFAQKQFFERFDEGMTDLCDPESENKKIAFQKFKEGAAGSHTMSMCGLALLYEGGYNIWAKKSSQEVPTIIKWWTRAAQLDDPAAKVWLHLSGFNLRQDAGNTDSLEDIFHSLMLRTQHMESPIDHYIIGWAYSDGIGVLKDSMAATHHWEIASKANFPPAMVQLGILYQETNPKRAAELMTKASKHGYSLAQTNLGIYYKFGIGVPVSITESFRYFSLSADQGVSAAQFSKAEAYEQGHGVEINPKLSTHYYHMAANQGYNMALFRLANAYQVGFGTEKNTELAFKLYKQAAREGLREAQYTVAREFLGPEYSSLHLNKYNPEKATKLLRSAASAEFGPAEELLGDLYFLGEHTVPKSIRKALILWDRAGLHGNITALEKLGKTLLLGHPPELKSNIQAALIPLEFGTDNKHPGCTFWLARLLLQLPSQPLDYKGWKLVDMLEFASENGYTEGYYLLGKLYLNDAVSSLYKNDENAALEYFEHGGYLGNSQCSWYASWIHRNRGNTEQATEWMQRSKEQSEPKEQPDLSDLRSSATIL